jgi:putative membrane protein
VVLLAEPVEPRTAKGGIVEWKIVAINFLYASLGVLLMYVSYRVIDFLTPHVDFPQELQRGNVAVAIFIGALFISIAVIIGGALN